MLVVWILAIPPVLAADQETCRIQISEDMTTAKDIYRSVLFGSRQDSDGKFTSKTGGFVDAARRGLFETRYRMTSELVWPAIESYRVLKCELLYICRGMGESFQNDDPSPLHMEVLGCAPKVMNPFDQCVFTGNNSTNDALAMTNECEQLILDTLAFEQATLKLAFAYDSGYRSILQFAGMVDHMMDDFPRRVFGPLRDMVNMLGKLHRIPCFLGQCDLPATDDLRLPDAP